MEVLVQWFSHHLAQFISPEGAVFIISMIPILELRGGLLAASLLKISAAKALPDVYKRQIVNTIYMISGSFGGVNLEDISAPRCFEIEKKLKEKCDIPIFHDDQHGTAVITLAGLTNALKVVGKKKEDVYKRQDHGRWAGRTETSAEL